MKLAKPAIDVGLQTNAKEAMLAFYQQRVGLAFDHALPIRAGQVQYRHDAAGSVVKINHVEQLIADTAPSGYCEVVFAQGGREQVERLTDPDGNRVALVPMGHEGVKQIGIRLGVRDVEAHRHFYGTVLGLPECPAAPGHLCFAAGTSRLLIAHDPQAPSDATIAGRGWRYITFQIFRVDPLHAEVLAAGVKEGMAPMTLGDTARFSMIRDPDGNWIELSQRKSIVGTLD